MNVEPESAFAPGLLGRLPETPRKVAILRASRIGDLICATPAARAVRAALPDAEITLITLPLLRDIAVRLPMVDRYEPFPGFPGLADQLFDARAATEFFARLQAERFDLALQLQGTGVYSNPFTLMLGARDTAGFVRPGDGPGLLAAALPLPETGHEIDRALALPEFLGAPSQGREPAFPLWPMDGIAADGLLADIPGPLIGLHPSARDRARQWPVSRFAEVGRSLRAEFGGTLVVLGGSFAAEVELAARLAAEVGAPVLNLAGRASLPVAGAVIEQLSLLVTTDSGPAHIAYALGTPTVTICGSADPTRYGPPPGGPFRALAHPAPCRPCFKLDLPAGDPCLMEVEVDHVLNAASELILGGDA